MLRINCIIRNVGTCVIWHTSTVPLSLQMPVWGQLLLLLPWPCSSQQYEHLMKVTSVLSDKCAWIKENNVTPLFDLGRFLSLRTKKGLSLVIGFFPHLWQLPVAVLSKNFLLSTSLPQCWERKTPNSSDATNSSASIASSARKNSPASCWVLTSKYDFPECLATKVLISAEDTPPPFLSVV